MIRINGLDRLEIAPRLSLAMGSVGIILALFAIIAQRRGILSLPGCCAMAGAGVPLVSLALIGAIKRKALQSNLAQTLLDDYPPLFRKFTTENTRNFVLQFVEARDWACLATVSRAWFAASQSQSVLEGWLKSRGVKWPVGRSAREVLLHVAKIWSRLEPIRVVKEYPISHLRTAGFRCGVAITSQHTVVSQYHAKRGDNNDQNILIVDPYSRGNNNESFPVILPGGPVEIFPALTSWSGGVLFFPREGVVRRIVFFDTGTVVDLPWLTQYCFQIHRERLFYYKEGENPGIYSRALASAEAFKAEQVETDIVGPEGRTISFCAHLRYYEGGFITYVDSVNNTGTHFGDIVFYKDHQIQFTFSVHDLRSIQLVEDNIFYVERIMRTVALPGMDVGIGMSAMYQLKMGDTASVKVMGYFTGGVTKECFVARERYLFYPQGNKVVCFNWKTQEATTFDTGQEVAQLFLMEDGLAVASTTFMTENGCSIRTTRLIF